MRPILFNKNETVFDTYGLGELNVTKGTVTRERNGNYTLYAEIPVNDPMVAIIEKEMKLKADAGLRTKNQTFEISRIVKDSSNIVKIYGQHISHKLEYMAIRNGVVLNGTAFNALSLWRGALIGDYRFDVWSDIQTSATTTLTIDKVTNARLALGGVEGSILDIWGGEYEFDNMTVRLHKQLGRTAPTVLEYGRNILSAEVDETIEDAYTSVLPFATYTPEKPEGDTSDSQPDPITVTIPENYVDSKYKALYAHRRIKVVDFSSEFNSDSKKKNIPNADKLRKLASDYMERNAIGKPKINTKIEYVDLAKTLDYADRAWIEELELCDIVPVYYPQIGLTDETAKVTTITYDFVNERNASVEFGEIGTNVRATMQSSLAGKVDEIAKAQQSFENSLPDYLLNAQGNKVWYNRPNDTTEHKVGDIWFEKNGLYDRMYIWNGSMWEKRIDTEDVDKIKKEVDKQISDAQNLTNQAIAEANKRAEEALKKAGTLPDTSKLSDQIKQQILSSPDLQNKVTEGVKSVDGDTIYSKIVSKVSQQFANKTDLDGLNRAQTDQGRDLLNLSKQITAQTIEYNKLAESNKLYERILGKSETDAPDKLSRLVMSSDIFQTEVGKYVNTDGANLLNGSKGPFKPDKKPANFDNNILYKDSTSIYMEQGQEYIVSAKTDGNFTAHHDGNKESDNVVLWLMDKDVRNYQIVSDLKTGTTGTKITWNKPTGTYHLRVNTYRKDPNKLKSVWNVKIEKGSIKSDYTLSLTDQLKADPLIEATRTQMTLLAGSWSVKNLNSAGDVLGAINLNPDGSVRINEGLLSVGEKTIIKDGVIKKSMIGKAQIGTAHIGEIDANIARLINVSAKNIVSDGLTANIIHGGVLASNNGKLKFDLDNSALESTSDESVIKRIGSGTNFPTQFLKFSKGWIQGRSQPVGLTILGSNRYGDGRSEDGNSGGFTGIRIWNGSNAEGYADSVDVVGDEIVLCDSPFQNRNGWLMKTTYSDTSLFSITNKRNSRIYAGDFLFEKSGGGNASLRQILWQIGDNIAQLYKFRNQHNEGTPGWNDTNKWGWS
jgi:phage minor structural protein, N-terminal domain protein|nr:MAG TPA: tail protein [Caudoviricetes sp.]